MATANAKPKSVTVAAIGSSTDLLLSLGSGSRPREQLGSNCVTDSNGTTSSAGWGMNTDTKHGASGQADNIYESGEHHYVDMSGNSAYYVTADTAGPVGEDYDDENIYEDIPSSNTFQIR